MVNWPLVFNADATLPSLTGTAIELTLAVSLVPVMLMVILPLALPSMLITSKLCLTC